MKIIPKKAIGYGMLIVGIILYLVQQTSPYITFANTTSRIIYLIFLWLLISIGFSVMFKKEGKISHSFLMMFEFVIITLTVNAILLIYDGSKGIWRLTSKEYFYCLYYSVNLTQTTYEFAIYMIMMILPVVMLLQGYLFVKKTNNSNVFWYCFILFVVLIVQIWTPFAEGII
jgi:hypothetical protein